MWNKKGDKMQPEDLYSERDKRRGWMIVYYPAKIGWLDRLFNWLGKRGNGHKR
jgi:hypothetical protein